MLKNDNPPGKPNPLWFDIYNAFGINYSSFPKKYQTKFREERNIRLSIHRLIKKDLIRPLSISLNNNALSDPRGYGYIFYYLTPNGHKVAEISQRKESCFKSNGDLEKIIGQLKALGNKQATVSQIRELLWQATSDKFNSKAEFERYWNNTRLGLALKKYTYKRTQIGRKEGKRKYILTIPSM